MVPLTIDVESIHSSGALSLLYAAQDELRRRYSHDDDAPSLSNDELAPPGGVFLVARWDEHLAGGVGLRSIGDPAQHVGEVKRLWVRPDLRRHGVAAALMNAVEEYARSTQYHQLYLETGWAQPEAQAFYPRTGWTSVADFPPGATCHPNSYRFFKVL